MTTHSDTIHFGLDTFGDMTVSDDGTPDSAGQVIRNLVDQAVLAESVGVYAIVFVYEWYDGQGNRWQSQPSKPAVFTTTVGNHVAIIPTITGRAWITGQSTLMLDPDDPWPDGYKIADTWPIDGKD